MNRTFIVAWREFTATVITKGFFIGVVMVPMIMMGAIFVVPLLTTDKPPKVAGEIAVIDRTGGIVSPGLEQRWSRETLSKIFSEQAQQAVAAAGEIAKKAGAPEGAVGAAGPMVAALAAGSAPDITVKILPADTKLEDAKAPLREGSAQDGGRIALVEIDADAVKSDKPGVFGAFKLFVKPKLDQRIERDVIGSAVTGEIVDQRIKASGQDPKAVRGLMSVNRPAAEVVLAEGSRRSVGGLQFIIPFGFIMLLWVAAMTGGQYLLTTTIEEKSNRIMEVLLSAVSPMQLMVGKILGQMGVGLLILLVYSTLGSGALISFKLFDALDFSNIGLLVVYFFIAFFLIASLMAAVGSAVSEIHEAQSLIGPIMMVLIVPMIAAPAIINNPNGQFATIASFIPPISPFVMVMRLPAAEGIPGWQIPATIAVGLASVVVAAWAAAKIFRIGILMYGKPPNFRTLIKWVRMA